MGSTVGSLVEICVGAKVAGTVGESVLDFDGMAVAVVGGVAEDA